MRPPPVPCTKSRSGGKTACRAQIPSPRKAGGSGTLQTNGKAGRLFQTLEAEIGHFGGVAEFIGLHSEERLHFALDVETGETPLLAFRRRRADGRVRAGNPWWTGKDTNG